MVLTVQKTENYVINFDLQDYDIISCRHSHLAVKHHLCISLDMLGFFKAVTSLKRINYRVCTVTLNQLIV